MAGSALLGLFGFVSFITTVIGVKKNNKMKVAANFTPVLFTLAGLLQIQANFTIKKIIVSSIIINLEIKLFLIFQAVNKSFNFDFFFVLTSTKSI